MVFNGCFAIVPVGVDITQRHALCGQYIFVFNCSKRNYHYYVISKSYLSSRRFALWQCHYLSPVTRRTEWTEGNIAACFDIYDTWFVFQTGSRWKCWGHKRSLANARRSLVLESLTFFIMIFKRVLVNTLFFST